MHLWPSMRIRDSFKHAYLKKLEWNLHRMNTEKRSQDSRKKQLLENQGDIKDGGEPTSIFHGLASICLEFLMIASCCYCCFCCGGIASYFSTFIYYFFSFFLLTAILFSIFGLFFLDWVFVELGFWRWVFVDFAWIDIIWISLLFVHLY